MSVRRILSVLLIIYFVVCKGVGLSVASPDEKGKIIDRLNTFQDGYTNRDTSIVNEYVHELFTEDILIIGTGANEWPKGKEEVKGIVRTDWLYWGALKLNVDEAQITVSGDVAWFALQGTSTRSFQTEEEIYQRYGLRDIGRIMEREGTNKQKLLNIIYDAAGVLLEVDQASTTFVYPIRVAGTLIKENGMWKFNQMVFSYPYPRRLILNERNAN